MSARIHLCGNGMLLLLQVDSFALAVARMGAGTYFRARREEQWLNQAIRLRPMWTGTGRTILWKWTVSPYTARWQRPRMIANERRFSRSSRKTKKDMRNAGPS